MAIGALGAAVLVVGLAVRGRDGSDSKAQVAGASTTSHRLVWSVGTRHVYALAWHGSQKVQLNALGTSSQSTSGRVDLEGELSLAAIESRGDTTTLALAFDTLPVHGMNVGGSDILGADAVRTVIGPRAFLDVDSRGAVQRIRHADASPPLFRALVRGIVANMQITLPTAPASTWRANEPGPNGRGPVQWSAGETGEIVRVRGPYTTLASLDVTELARSTQKLTATTHVKIDASGQLRAIDAEEDIDLTRGDEHLLTAHETMRLVHVRAEAATALAMGSAWSEEIPGADPTEAMSKEAELAQIAGAWTLTAIEDVLLEAAAGRKTPSGFLVEASSYLAIHPEACAGLATLFPDPRLGVVGRERLLDVLVAAGTDAAQAALRDALSAPAAHADGARFASYVQRLGGLDRPSDATISFLHTTASSGAGPHERRSALVTVGAVAGKLAKSDRRRARAEAGVIAASLRAAQSPDDKRAAITALGNAGMHEDVPVLVEHAEDREPDVRSAVALALRHTDTVEGRRTLLAMLSDRDVSVQRLALDGLAQSKLAREDMNVAADAILGGRTSNQLDSRIVALCSEHLDAGPSVRLVLLHVLARAGEDHRLEGRIQSLLQRLPA